MPTADQLRQMAMEGMTQQAMADRHGVHRQSIVGLMRRFGIASVGVPGVKKGINPRTLKRKDSPVAINPFNIKAA